MDWADFLSLDIVEALVPLAEARDAFPGGWDPRPFLEVYRKAGGAPEKLPRYWVVIRQGVLRRQLNGGRDPVGWWEDVPPGTPGAFPDGEWPTRQALALAMWGWADDDLELLDWVEDWKALRDQVPPTTGV